jgi:glycosyltransferase involved in cell wall biosynthesis
MDANFDLPLVFSAFARVVEKYPETRLMLIGKSSPAMLNTAREYGIAEWVISAGYVPYDLLPTYLGCADIFLLPFPSTVYNVCRWPSKICDYMASGRPTISNPTGDIKSLFEKHKVGLLADESAEAFAAKIFFLFEHPDAVILLGQNARHAAEIHYSWSYLIQGLESFYLQVLERAGKQN